MEWRGRRGSRNIEDRRLLGGRPGGGRGLALGGGMGGLGVVAVLLVGWALGIDVTPLLQDGGGAAPPRVLTDEDRAMGEFVSVTLADTEEVWASLFADQLGATYRPATLVLFKDSITSACGGASQVTGPFYCPADRRIYLDTGFFTTLDAELGAGGDFAAAYVVAHEVGHHVQKELGLLDQTAAGRQGADAATGNAISVRVELMADCLAGVWARTAAARFGSVEPGDVAEAMAAAGRIGDDRLQRAAGRTPRPDSFTHGTSDQRMRWFQTGHDSGQIESCNTFGAADL